MVISDLELRTIFPFIIAFLFSLLLQKIHSDGYQYTMCDPCH